ISPPRVSHPPSPAKTSSIDARVKGAALRGGGTLGTRGARPTRRDLLAGAVGGVTGLAAGAGLDSLRRSSGAVGSVGNDPVLLGRASDDIPAGVVRADLRAFHEGSGSDYHDAFVAALDAADAVYVPPGIWGTSETIELKAGKVLWSDAAYDR